MSELNSGNDPLQNPGIDYERRDAAIRGGVLLGGVVLALVCVAMLGVVLFLGGLRSYQTATAPTPLPLLELRPTPPSPRLQPNPIDQQSAEQELADFRAREEAILTSYGWVNRPAGTTINEVNREQVELLRRFRASESEPDREAFKSALLLSINTVAAGLGATG